MRSLFYAAIVAVLTAATVAVPFPGPVATQKRAAFHEPTTPHFLRPLKRSDLEPPDSRQARTLPEFSSFKPLQDANMLFGGLAEPGKLFLANMTLYAPENLPIVMMEAFEGLTSAVDCMGDDGEMSLTFKSKMAYEHALRMWSYINAKEETEFVMIANHDSCGPKGQRQGYKIANVVNDAAKLIVTLKAAAVAWNEFAGSFDLDFGHHKMAPKDLLSLEASGAIGGTGEAMEGFKSELKGAFEGGNDTSKGRKGGVSLPINFPIRIFRPDTEIPLYKGPSSPAEVELSCENCYVYGNLRTTGTLKVENFKTTLLKIDVEPRDFSAAAVFRLDLVNIQRELPYSRTIFDTVIPYTGIEIPGILSVGAKAGFVIHGAITFTGSATFHFGYTSSLPNGGKMTLVIVGEEKTGVTGLNKIETKPIISFDKGQVDLGVTTVPDASITYGFHVLNKYGIEGGIKMGIPVGLNISAGRNPEGWCPGSNITTGVAVSAGAAFKMDFGFWQNKQTPLFKVPLLADPWTCAWYAWQRYTRQDRNPKEIAISVVSVNNNQLQRQQIPSQHDTRL
ncbi:hypothetical protein PRK78_006488 [Emydomyces testavorans]|uniref:Uncharacterized protein n=1 Tax=Emydomyces testavorans TaxID=2070801 RepID=A0AAF0DLG8_9EURO|nr:hypothetical protein PRK78_006488 [Emydomyces testavorans]